MKEIGNCNYLNVVKIENKKKEKFVITETTKPEMTYEYGKCLGEQALPGQIYCLVGDLGVGKTLFTQGFAKGLGISEPVNSPTFTIVQEYHQGRIPLFHFDVYRISDPEEMYEIGYEEYFFGNGVCIVEWADLIWELIPEEAVVVRIEKNTELGFEYRKTTTHSFATEKERIL